MLKKILIPSVFLYLLFSCSSQDNSMTSDDMPDENETEQELPEAVDDEFYVQQNEKLTISTLLDNDVIFDYGRISSIDETSSQGGVISSQGNNTYIYTPATNFVGTDTFTYTLCDAEIPANCSQGTVTIEVLEEVSDFEAVDDYVFVEEGTVSIILDNLLDNDFVANAEGIESINTESSSGQVVLNDDGTVTYYPVSGFSGNDSFEYTICTTGEVEDCDTATVSITISTSITFNIPADLADYYQNTTFTNDKDLLFKELNKLVSTTHTTELTYTPDIWNTLQVSDLDPTNSENIVLIYGYDDTDTDLNNDRTRDKDNTDSTGSGSTTYWNREHIFPRSLGNPNLEFVGPGADAHNLRPSDPGTNSSRSNKKFAEGSGAASYTTSGSDWYPGDEWIGDIARTMMYMYIRYEDQCTPRSVGEGNLLTTDSNMVDLFLEWNAKDPVSDFEIQRNNTIESAQGNRNPFIDNPYLATIIWGGENAENTWE